MANLTYEWLIRRAYRAANEHDEALACETIGRAKMAKKLKAISTDEYKEIKGRLYATLPERIREREWMAR